MSHWLAGLLALALPSAGFRLEAVLRLYEKEAPLRRLGLSLVSLVFGGLQDLAVAAVLSANIVLAGAFSPALGVTVAIVATLAFQLYTLIDAVLFRTADVRMNLGFLGFAQDMSSLKSSLGALTPRAVFAAACAAATIALWLGALPAGPDALPIIAAIGAGAFVLSFVVRAQLSASLPYTFGNAVIEECWRALVAKKGARVLASERVDERTLERFRALGPKCEQYERPSAEVMLLKNTTGFFGEKRFELRVEVGERPNVVIVFLESLSARDTGILGGGLATPCFDAAAREGVLFENFYSGGIQTSRAVLSTLFGLWPRLAYRSEMQSDAILPLPGLGERMSAAGYRSVYWHGGKLAFERQGRFFGSHGFVELSGDEALAGVFPTATRSSWGYDDEWVFRYALERLEQARDDKQPIFSVLATLTSHHPYLVPPGFSPTAELRAEHPVQERFLRALHYSDACFGDFLAGLKKRGLERDTIVIALGDHGPPIGEMESGLDRYQHLQEERVRVPCLIWAPGRAAPLRATEVASQVDILPTVMDALSLTGANVSVGESLLRVRDDRFAAFNNALTVHRWGLRRGNLKYLWSPLGGESLYDLAADPKEHHDLGRDHPDVPALREHIELIHRVLEAAHVRGKWATGSTE